MDIVDGKFSKSKFPDPKALEYLMYIYHLAQYQAAADNDLLCNLKIKERCKVLLSKS